MSTEHQPSTRGNPSPQELEREYDELYERFAKPLEEQHRGEYLAVSPKGKTLLGKRLTEVAQQAAKTLGPGVFLFKVGEDVVGNWR